MSDKTIVLALLLLGFAQERPTDFDRAEREIVRVAPTYYLGLPSAVRDALDVRGCTVPQTWGEVWPSNAVRGHFVGASSDDWAVLCSIRGSSSILVFSRGKVVASLARSPDRQHLAGILPGRAAFERHIDRIAPRAIRDYCRAFEQQCPPIRHDGIEDSPKSNVSEIRYFDGAKWIVLQGAD